MIGTYDGGKGKLYQKLINLMPPHGMYIEPFIGGGSVASRKRPAKRNVGLDLDVDVIAEWQQWAVSSEMAIGSRHLDDTARNAGAEAPPKMTMGATIAKNGDTAVSSSMTMGSRTDWEFLCADALTYLETAVFPPNTLIYADPPYLASTRASNRDLYKHELKTEAEHRRLLECLLSLDCMVMVSGYWSELYAELLADWETAVFPAYTRSGRPVEEWVWMNYPMPDRLHDYSFLGDNYRERERIKRKTSRWVNKLQKMERLERQAIWAAIDKAGIF